MYFGFGLTSRLPGDGSRRRAGVVEVPGIQYPLGHVPVHIVEAEAIGDAERTNRQGLLAVGAFGPGAIWIGSVIVGQVRRDRLSKTKCGGGAGAAGVFPLCFAWESI